MRFAVVTFALVFLVSSVWAASPGNAPDTPLVTFRVEAAEVHVAISAFDKHQRAVNQLSLSDFTLFRDGRPVQETVALERRHDSPIMATVMTDVSDSMIKAVPMARDSWSWMGAHLLRAGDHISYFDFGAEVSAANAGSQSEMHLTSFYDCLLKLIPRVEKSGNGRRAIILFTDGGDNNSIHPLQDAIDLAVERDIAVYVITTWKFKIQYDERVLDQLTSGTGGRYYAVKNTKEMQSALQAITDELRNGYEIVFGAGKAQSGMHRIAMQPTSRRLHFYHREAYFQPNASGAKPLLMASER